MRHGQSFLGEELLPVSQAVVQGIMDNAVYGGPVAIRALPSCFLLVVRVREAEQLEAQRIAQFRAVRSHLRVWNAFSEWTSVM